MAWRTLWRTRGWCSSSWTSCPPSAHIQWEKLELNNTNHKSLLCFHSLFPLEALGIHFQQCALKFLANLAARSLKASGRN
uniref:Uncharacterized protein n=1 Tax=Zonotrichia albicollis TaxID=44394 RepID=A0A8D2MB43_ZONAL